MERTSNPYWDDRGAESQGSVVPAEANPQVVDSLIALLQGVDSRFVVVGEDDNTHWKIGGPLTNEYICTPDIESRAVIVGKVRDTLAEGQSRMVVSLANQGLLTRAQRDAQEEVTPPEGEKDKFISGPATILDVLAIYR